MLPDITRTDMLDHFQPIHAFDDDIEAHVVQKQITEMAQSLADLAEAHTPESSGTFAAAMDELWEVLAAVRDTINDCDAEVIANCDLAEAIAADTELLINGAVFFAHPLLRDVALVAADRSVKRLNKLQEPPGLLWNWHWQLGGVLLVNCGPMPCVVMLSRRRNAGTGYAQFRQCGAHWRRKVTTA